MVIVRLSYVSPEGVLPSDKLSWGTIAMDAANRLGVLWSDRGDPEDAEVHLKRAETFYTQLKPL